jgi:hypothetical protein
MAKTTQTTVPAKTLHAHNAPEPISVDKIDDDKEYDVTLLKTIIFAEVPYRPTSHHVFRGGFLRTLMSDPKNEGAFGGAKVLS